MPRDRTWSADWQVAFFYVKLMPVTHIFTTGQTMLQRIILLNCCMILFCSFAYTQDKAKVKFGSVSPEDFAPRVYAVDSGAHAVVIADIGSSRIEGNTKGWFSLIFKHYKRIHILNKNGYDIANVEIPLYSEGDFEEQLEKLRAVTYNLENGKVVETKLDVKSQVFKDRINKNRVIRKFTFPNVKEGSIIEFEYIINSDYLRNLQPWEFQGTYPRLWSEYNLSVPEFLYYVFLSQGDKTYDINEPRKDRIESYRITDGQSIGPTDRFQFNANVSDYRWVKKNVKPLKEESFTSTLNNHVSKLEFQLTEYRQPLGYKKIMGTWETVAEDLLKAEYFGAQLSKDNGWLKETVRPVTDNATTQMEKAQKIYAYVRDQYTCTSQQGLTLDQNLRNVVKNKSGTVAEINLLLTAMLRYAGIAADPVILSTRNHGYTYPIYPLLSQYNYVITRIALDKQYFLDASDPGLGFGRLPEKCYNGHARVINEKAEQIELNSDELTENKFTSFFIINDEKGKLIGSVQQTPGYYESVHLRNRIREKGSEDILRDVRKGIGSDISVSNFRIDSITQPEHPVKINYDIDFNHEAEDILYINPTFGEGYRENPFKSAERAYPVEMPFGIDEVFTMQMAVPNGYVVDELPKSLIVKLNEEGDGAFEYRISQSGSDISFRFRLRISRTFFLPEEYEMLREFFNLVVKKQAEQIVFKKKP